MGALLHCERKTTGREPFDQSMGGERETTGYEPFDRGSGRRVEAGRDLLAEPGHLRVAPPHLRATPTRFINFTSELNSRIKFTSKWVPVPN